MATFVNQGDFAMHTTFSGDTDPGNRCNYGDTELKGFLNQDVWNAFPFDGGIAYSLFDGHGKIDSNCSNRDSGGLAAKTAELSFKHFICSTNIADIRNDTNNVLNSMFESAHQKVRIALQDLCIKNGFESKIEDGIVYYKSYGIWKICRGGTTASVVLLFDDMTMITANVGDSTCIITGLDVSNSLVSSNWTVEFGGKCTSITSDPSPDNPRFRAAILENGGKIVYQYPRRRFDQCPDVFDENGEVTNKIYSCKNVSGQSACIVCTPSKVSYSTALAMTTAIGDFSLEKYGVSHSPDWAVFDLNDACSHSGETNINATICLASDGVWDNYVMEHSTEHPCFAEKIEEAESKLSDIDDQVNFLMKDNEKEGKKNFGKSRDNATLLMVKVEVTPREEEEVQPDDEEVTVQQMARRSQRRNSRQKKSSKKVNQPSGKKRKNRENNSKSRKKTKNSQPLRHKRQGYGNFKKR